MPIIDDVTPNLGLPLPNADNFLADDVTRIRTALGTLDTEVNSKANAASTASVLAAKADLVSGKVPASQLPAYVDDVIEVADFGSLPTTGETGKIYVTLNDNQQYRWSGSTYIQLSKSPGTTDEVPEGTTNKYFTDSRALAAIPAADSATAGLVKIGAGLGIDSNGKLFASAGSGSVMSILEIVPVSNGLATVTVPGGYVAGTILVGVDGTLLPPSDYTATNGTSIGFVGFTVGTANTVMVVKLATVTLASLPAGSVDTTQLADLAVTTAKLANTAVTTAKLADSAVTTTKLADGSVTAAKLASGVVATFKNRLVNPEFRIDQENAGAVVSLPVSGAGKFIVDQWFAFSVGATISAQQIAGIADREYSLRFTGAASNSGFALAQRIEASSCADLKNQTVAVSLKSKASSARTLTWAVSFATAKNNFASTTQIATGTIDVTTSASALSFTFNAGASAGNGLLISFTGGALLAGATIDFDQIQLEKGSAASEFEMRAEQQELALCQRYWENGVIGFNGAYQAAVSSYTPYANFIVPKRVAPTMAITVGSSTNLNGIAITAQGTNSFRYGGSAIATGVVVLTATYTANARL